MQHPAKSARQPQTDWRAPLQATAWVVHSPWVLPGLRQPPLAQEREQQWLMQWAPLPKLFRQLR